MVRARHGRGMASMNQTRPHCVNQMGKTHSKPLAARHAMCESDLMHPSVQDLRNKLRGMHRMAETALCLQFYCLESPELGRRHATKQS